MGQFPVIPIIKKKTSSILSEGLIAFYPGPFTWNGINQFQNIDGLETLIAGLTKLTISAWIKPINVIKAAGQTILSIGDSSANQYIDFFIRGGSTGALGVVIRRSAGTIYFKALNSNVFTDNVRVNVIVSINGPVATLYVGGTAYAQSDVIPNSAGTVLTDLTDLDNARLGAIKVTGLPEFDFFEGDEDTTRVYNIAATSELITAIINE